MTTHWAYDAIFYHVYPLGLCGAPARNDLTSLAVPRLEELTGWIGHLKQLGVNALYLGPVFESSSHGYDTADYYRVDRRLGDNQTLADIVSAFHQNGIRVILDGVFHHVGRDFWAFRDVLQRGAGAETCDWFQGLSFDGQSPYHDPFVYEGWNGHYDLVKLNLHNPAVKAHIFQAVEMWIRTFDIDGLRLDVADCLDPGFVKELAAFCRGLCRGLCREFWLMGEVVHGDYRNWANAETLDSVTNYELYKGLYSSHVDKNYYELAYTLNRQFGEQGLYRHLPLYNFADNHDVNRVASNLTNPSHLYPLYCLLFTVPGVPSIYYGSEWGIEGQRKNGDDRPLRPRLALPQAAEASPHRELSQTIARMARIRHGSQALRRGDYCPLLVSHEQLAFARQVPGECIVVLANAADESVPFEFSVPEGYGTRLVDLLNPGDEFRIRGGQAKVDEVWPHWARVLAVQ